MLVSTTRTGSHRAGTITATVGAVAYGFAYSRTKVRGVEELTVWPHGGNLAVGPLGNAIHDCATEAAVAMSRATMAWAITMDATGVTVRPATEADRRAA